MFSGPYARNVLLVVDALSSTVKMSVRPSILLKDAISDRIIGTTPNTVFPQKPAIYGRSDTTSGLNPGGFWG